MLTGQLPYGEAFERARSREQLARLTYRPASSLNPLVPPWLDAALERAVRLDPEQRYPELSEWLHDLEHPNPAYVRAGGLKLDDRAEVRRWQAVAASLAVALVATLWAWLGR